MNTIDGVLRPAEAHVFAVWLKATAPVSRAYRRLLSPIEIARADRFALTHLTRSYELSEGALRLLLAHFLSCPPRDIAFGAGPRGKPVLQQGSRIRFNMAHSGGLALYAFTVDSEIGIDVEQMRDIPDIEQIASHYFCPAEASEILVGAEDLRTQAFFRCWTRKEAYIKAVGDGLHLPLDKFQVTLSSDAPVKFVHIGNNISAAAGWTLQHLDPAPNYVGALAYQGAARNIIWRGPLDAEQLWLLKY